MELAALAQTTARYPVPRLASGWCWWLATPVSTSAVSLLAAGVSSPRWSPPDPTPSTSIARRSETPLMAVSSSWSRGADTERRRLALLRGRFYLAPPISCSAPERRTLNIHNSGCSVSGPNSSFAIGHVEPGRGPPSAPLDHVKDERSGKETAPLEAERWRNAAPTPR